MPDFVEVGKKNDVADGQLKMVTVEDREILLARVSGKYYAAYGRCPHMGGKLWLGKLNGTVVTCPRHSSRFDLTDGHVIRWTNWSGIKLALSKIVRRPRPLKTYKVKIEGDKILVAVSEKAGEAAP
jgi:3-phenylpropionate/trans-cinnamate dioxygenase ferredoxin subunit